MTGGLENVRLHGVLMMRGGGGGGGGSGTSSTGIIDYERGTELLNIGGSGGVGSGGGRGLREKVDDPVCAGCSDKIVQRYLLQVNGVHYHTQCLRCAVCGVCLQGENSCFVRDERVYCKGDYYRTYGSAQCAKCSRWISSSDWVRRARDSQAEQIYHLACFACDACHRQLSTGEEFALVEKKLLCKTHYQETVESGEESCDGDGDDDAFDGKGSGGERERGSGRSSKSKTKRVRTTFTDEQLQILQANFQIDSNPDGQDLERIAQITGLSKRVTQVWFQNSRARQKKHHHSGSGSGGGGGGGGGKPPPQLNNNSVPGVMLLGTNPPVQSGSPGSIHHHVGHVHHGVVHQQQISRVLTRERGGGGGGGDPAIVSSSQQPVE